MTIRRFLFFSAPSCLFLLLFFPRNLSYNSLCQKKTNPPKLHEFKRSGLLAWIKERERERKRGEKNLPRRLRPSPLRPVFSIATKLSLRDSKVPLTTTFCPAFGSRSSPLETSSRYVSTNNRIARGVSALLPRSPRGGRERRDARFVPERAIGDERDERDERKPA